MLEKAFYEGLIDYHKLILKMRDVFELTSEETVVLFQLFQSAERKRFNLSALSIGKAVGINRNETGIIIESLQGKNVVSVYLGERPNNRLGEMFDLKPFFERVEMIFKEEIKKEKEETLTNDLAYIIDLIQETFAKPLSPTALEIVRQWFSEGYTRKEIEEALSLTLEHRRKSVNYIDRVLRSDMRMESKEMDEETAEALRRLVGKK